MTLIEQMARLPRAARWALIAVGVIVAYFAVIEPALNHLNSLRARVSAKEAIIANAVRDKPKIDSVTSSRKTARNPVEFISRLTVASAEVSSRG